MKGLSVVNVSQIVRQIPTASSPIVHYSSFEVESKSFPPVTIPTVGQMENLLQFFHSTSSQALYCSDEILLSILGILLVVVLIIMLLIFGLLVLQII